MKRFCAIVCLAAVVILLVALVSLAIGIVHLSVPDGRFAEIMGRYDADPVATVEMNVAMGFEYVASSVLLMFVALAVGLSGVFVEIWSARGVWREVK